jgi:hypothetical protein
MKPVFPELPAATRYGRRVLPLILVIVSGCVATAIDRAATAADADSIRRQADIHAGL